MFGFITDVFRTVWNQDLPTLRNWVLYGTLQPAIALPGPGQDEPPIDEDDVVYDDEPEHFDEVDSTETYIDDDDFKDEAMGDILKRSNKERQYINELFHLHGVAAQIEDGPAMGAHSFHAYEIELGITPKRQLEMWASVCKIAPQIESILHKKRIKEGAIAEGITRGLIPENYRTAIRVTDQPMALEVSRIDVRDLLFNIEEYNGEPHTAFAGIGYANGGVINIIWDLNDDDNPHLMIAGRTGSGKSVLLTSVVATLAHATSPDDLDLYLVDGKNEDVAPFASLPHARAYSHEPKDNIQVIKHVAAIVDERNNSDDRKRVVLVIDELADVVATGDTDAAITALTKIAQKGRSKNVTLIGCTQKPKASNVGGDTKSNMPLKFIGAVGSPEDAKIVSGIAQTGAEKLPGRGSFLSISGGGITRFQSPFIEDVDHAVEVICNAWGYEIIEDGEQEEAEATADITMQKLGRVFDECYGGLDDDGEPVWLNAGMKRAMEVINNGVAPTGGRKRKNLRQEVNQYLFEWLEHPSTARPQPVHTGNSTRPLIVTDGSGDGLRNSQGREDRRVLLADLPIAVKPLFVNRNIKH